MLLKTKQLLFDTFSSIVKNKRVIQFVLTPVLNAPPYMKRSHRWLTLRLFSRISLVRQWDYFSPHFHSPCASVESSFWPLTAMYFWVNGIKKQLINQCSDNSPDASMSSSKESYIIVVSEIKLQSKPKVEKLYRWQSTQVKKAEDQQGQWKCHRNCFEQMSSMLANAIQMSVAAANTSSGTAKILLS